MSEQRDLSVRPPVAAGDARYVPTGVVFLVIGRRDPFYWRCIEVRGKGNDEWERVGDVIAGEEGLYEMTRIGRWLP